MALNPDNIVVAGGGTVYIAPVGTVAPATPSEDPAAGWVDVGLISEDGVEFTPSVETNDINSWQTFRPVSRVVTGRSEELAFTLLEWTGANLELAFGGGTTTTATGVDTYTPPSVTDIDLRAAMVDWTYGGRDFRLVVPRALVTDLGAFTLSKADAAGLPITLTTLAGSDDAASFYVLMDTAAA